MRRTFRYDPHLGRLVEVSYGAERVAPDVLNDLPAYTSPIDGRVVDGRAQRREDLQRAGCRPYDAGERAQQEQRLVHEDAALTRSIDATVDRWYATNPSRNHELLEQAIRAGADVRYERR